MSKFYKTVITRGRAVGDPKTAGKEFTDFFERNQGRPITMTIREWDHALVLSALIERKPPLGRPE